MRTSFKALCLFAALAGCSGSTGTTPQTGTDAGTNPTDTGGATTDTGGGGNPGLANDEYCRSNTPGNCRAPAVNTCGVCVPPPPIRAPIARTNCDDTQRREFCREGDVGAPNLSCFQSGMHPTAGTSRAVTVYGSVKVFGNGGDSQHIRVTIHRLNADRTPGEMVGSAVTDLMHPARGTEDVYSPSRDRVLFTRNLGGYQIANVPTETELLVITEGDPADRDAQGLWSHRVYDYNVVFFNREIGQHTPPAGIDGASAIFFQPRVISNSDWTAIPAASTLTSGITLGRGVIAGEVHDCDDVRLSNATVETSPRRQWDGPVIYFSENDTNPLPDLSRDQRGTSLLGTYAIFDLDPGPVNVAAIGYRDATTPVHLGSYPARVYADSITIVTFRGLRAWQAPTP